MARAKGVNEAEFTRQIHQAFSVAGTCILGYNNIRFDDEVSRNIFYRNFYDPYAYSWQNGNSRWDLLDVMRACYALRPDGIVWPENEDGFPSFRLEHLTRANGVEHTQAHDAMSDVYATITMAKLVKQAQPRLFDFLLQHRNKHKAERPDRRRRNDAAGARLRHVWRGARQHQLGVAVGLAPGQQKRGDHVRSRRRYDAAADAER